MVPGVLWHHEIIEWFGMESTLVSSTFSFRAMGRDAVVPVSFPFFLLAQMCIPECFTV